MLLWKFNRGDREVLHQIYQSYKNELVTLAAALLYDKTLAEDVVHEVFVTLVRPEQRLQLRRSLKGYLFTAVANRARSKNRQTTRDNGVSLEQIAATKSNSSLPQAAAIFGEEFRHLSLALCQLPYQQREVIILRLYCGMKFKAIADMQGISPNTAQGRYRYGLEKLRSLLNGEVTK